jgi:hypothetical protein
MRRDRQDDNVISLLKIFHRIVVRIPELLAAFQLSEPNVVVTLPADR